MEMKELKIQSKVLLLLCKALSQTDECFLTRQIAAKHTTYKVKTFNSALRELEELGFVIVTRANGYYSKVKLNVDVKTPTFLFKGYDIDTLESLTNLYMSDISYNTFKDLTETGLVKKHKFGPLLVKAKLVRLLELEDTMQDLFKEHIELIDDKYLEHTVLGSNGLLKYAAIKVRQGECVCDICGETEQSKFAARKSVCQTCHKERKNKRNRDLSDLNTVFKTKITYCKSRAKQKDMGMDLTVEYCIELYNKQKGLCHYCKEPFDQDNKYQTLSIDRVDSNLGYIQGNIVFSWYIYNVMKSDMGEKEFRYYINKLAKC